MKIKRLINNNIVVVDGATQGSEVLIMGKGVGFSRHVGDEVEEGLVEKRYKLVDASVANHLADLVQTVPANHVELANKMMAFIEQAYEKKTNGTLYISLLDHVSSSLARHERGFDIANPMLFDIKRFYREEYAVGLELLGIIEQQTGVRLADDEAGFIALHLVNAWLDQPEADQASDIMTIVRGVLNIVKYQLNVEYDEESVYYFRFVTHLKFFAQRLLNAKPDDQQDAISSSELLEIVRQQHSEAYAVTFRVEEYLNRQFGYVMTDGERLYLCIHIGRVIECCR